MTQAISALRSITLRRMKSGAQRAFASLTVALAIGGSLGFSGQVFAADARNEPARSATPAARTDAKSPQPATPPPTVAAPSSESASQYIIGPGDGIQVFVWRNPELSVTVPVRPDGKVSTPLVEDMVAVGKTPSQLARDIETRLAEYIRSPQVSIIVNSALGAASQIKIIGQVAKPQSLPFHEGMTLLDVALAVGGLTEFAAGNRAKLIRKDANGQEKATRVRLEDLLRKGKVSENVPMKPGDVLIVPESLF